MSNHKVSITDDTIYYEHPEKGPQKIFESSLESVTILTTDDGPFAEDVFWILATKDKRLVIPSGAEGIDVLIEVLQRKPGFNNEAVIAAMACVEVDRFECWSRSR